MDVAREAAPEIDRLVLSVNGRMSEAHGDRLLGLARDRGLDSLELLPHFADFLLAGVLTDHLATARMRYMPPDRVLTRLAEMENKGLIQHRGEALVATGPMRDLLDELLSARASVASEAWGGAYEEEVATATRHAREVSRAASADHEVAVAHRGVLEPADSFLALHTYLTNLRYIRQHDHAEAWLTRGLTPAAMVVMTALWHGETVEAGGDGLDQLVTSGLATSDPPALTDEGRVMREEIEADTNERARVSFRLLDEEAAREFLEALRKLPGTV